MARAGDGDELILAEQLGLDVSGLHGQRHEGHVQLARENPLHKLLARPRSDRDLGVLVPLAQHLQNVGQGLGTHHPRSAPDPQAAALGPGQLRQFCQRGVVLAQDEVRAFKQVLARLREDDAARHTQEERDADLLLQLLDLHAQRGLRVVYALGGGGERVRLGDRQEGLQLSNLHPRLRYQG